MKANRVLRWFTPLVLVMFLLSSCRSLFGPEPTPTLPPLPATQPLLLDRSPARGEEAELDGSIVLTFDQPMDPASTEAAFSIEPSVAGDLTWEDSTTLVFTPRRSWERATRYRVKLDVSAKSSGGLGLREEVNFTFATVGYLEVTQVIPADEMSAIEGPAPLAVEIVGELVIRRDPGIEHPVLTLLAGEAVQNPAAGLVAVDLARFGPPIDIGRREQGKSPFLMHDD